MGLLGPGVCGLGGADTLNIGYSLWQDCPCIVPPRVSSDTSAADEGDSIPTLISDDRFSTIPATDGSSVLAYTMVPWRLSHLGTGTRFIVADSIRNLWQKDQAAVMPHRMLEQTTSRNGDYANHGGYHYDGILNLRERRNQITSN